jgi:hypothetical protein
VHSDRYIGFLYTLANESKKGNGTVVQASLSAYLSDAKSFDDRLAFATETLKRGEPQSAITNTASRDIGRQRDTNNGRQPE